LLAGVRQTRRKAWGHQVWEHVVNPTKKEQRYIYCTNGNCKGKRPRNNVVWGKKLVEVCRDTEILEAFTMHSNFGVGVIEHLPSFEKMTSSTMHWTNIGWLRLSVERKRAA
jgi:hypothetical protein